MGRKKYSESTIYICLKKTCFPRKRIMSRKTFPLRREAKKKYFDLEKTHRPFKLNGWSLISIEILIMFKMATKKT